MLEITLKEEKGFLTRFAEKMGSTVEKGRVTIPANKGKGYIQGYALSNSIAMMVENYELNVDLLSRRLANPESNEGVVIAFNNVFHTKDDVGKRSSEVSVIKDLPSVQIGRGNIDFEMIYPGKNKRRSIFITIDAANLRTLLETNEEHAILKNITNSNQLTLFEEFISPQIQKVAMELIESNIPEALQNFYFRIKAEELICLLFVELFKRENTPVNAMNENDVQMIYQIRSAMLSNLDTPPVIGNLAIEAGMSESKLKRLFKQIFGNSIFNYYQSVRMQEAAWLIKEQKLSVSEVGYQMGFSNLSHFTRLFETHIGMKPKKYSASYN